jgi:exosortase
MAHASGAGAGRPIEGGLKAACLLGAVALCVPGLLLLPRIWAQTDYLGHGYVIPAVTGWLLYRRRDELAAAWREAEPPSAGPLVVLLAASFEVFAVLGDVIFAAGVGVPLLLAATLWALGGRRLLEPAALPLGFLVMMAPPPGFLVDRIQIGLKFFVTWVSVEGLQAAGFVVTAVGNQIMIPGHVLFVAEACTGLTSIVTMLPLAVVVAYFFSHGTWRRIIVVLSVVPLSVAANVGRVVVTVAMVDEWGIEWAQGYLHESFGVVTFVVGTIALLAVAKVLR